MSSKCTLITASEFSILSNSAYRITHRPLSPRCCPRATLTHTRQITQNVRAGKGKCAYAASYLWGGEECVTVVDRERSGDPALSAGGYGAEPHTRQGNHAPSYRRTYEGWQPVASAVLSPFEKGRRSFPHYILRPCCPGLGASTLHILSEKNWRSAIGHNAHLRQPNDHAQFGSCDKAPLATVIFSVTLHEEPGLTEYTRPCRRTAPLPRLR